jgi:hypothetical protein
MTQLPEDPYKPPDNIQGPEEYSRYRRFVPLETVMDQLPIKAGRIVRKHWTMAEKEQYPFWIGIIAIALLLVIGMYLREVNGRWATVLATVALVALVPVLVVHIRRIQGRFERMWSVMSADGELFRFLRDAGVLLGHPVEMGKPDERFSTRLEVPFPDAVRAVEAWLNKSALPDRPSEGAPAGLKISPFMSESHGGETHHVYEVEYSGAISRAFSIRVNAADSGSEITVGFALRPSRAETREKFQDNLIGHLQDRMIAAKVLGDIREQAGVEPETIPALTSEQFLSGPAASSAT